MIRRLYIHNFRCLENFELPISGQSSVLLIGKNGAGKTSVGLALELLQKVARGTNRVGELIKPKDLTRGRADAPVRFEIEVELSSRVFKYSLAFEYPLGFRELRVLEERLTVDGKPVYGREIAQVQLERIEGEREANFRIDWHLVALPIVQLQSKYDPLYIFKDWLAGAIILRPIPGLISGDSDDETLEPDIQALNLGAWFSGLIASAPAAYSKIDAYLKQVMPDFLDIKNPSVGRDSRSLVCQFLEADKSLTVPFSELSDGEKCFMINALVIATNEAFGPRLCFWDEPDSYLSPSEVGLSMMELRQAFQEKGQLITTSHNPEAIRRFSDENTLILYRNSHLEPTIARRLEEIRSSGEIKGDLVDALVRGDLSA